MRGCVCVCGGALVAIISLMVNNLGNTVFNNYYFGECFLKIAVWRRLSILKLLNYIFPVNTSLLYSSHA